jgi:hypothetical protein
MRSTSIRGKKRYLLPAVSLLTLFMTASAISFLQQSVITPEPSPTKVAPIDISGVQTEKIDFAENCSNILPKIIKNYYIIFKFIFVSDQIFIDIEKRL